MYELSYNDSLFNKETTPPPTIACPYRNIIRKLKKIKRVLFFIRDGYHKIYLRGLTFFNCRKISILNAYRYNQPSIIIVKFECFDNSVITHLHRKFTKLINTCTSFISYAPC